MMLVQTIAIVVYLAAMAFVMGAFVSAIMLSIVCPGFLYETEENVFGMSFTCGLVLSAVSLLALILNTISISVV
jgi:hypothetical protein